MSSSNGTQREVIRCKGCNLNQFRPGNDCCRKCDKPLYAPEPTKELEKPTIIPPLRTPRRVPITRYTPTLVSMGFGPILRRVRLELGYTQSQSSYISGLARPHVARIEGGFHDPSPITLDKMCQALYISISDLVFCMDFCLSPDDCITSLQLLSLSKFLTTDQLQRVSEKARNTRFI